MKLRDITQKIFPEAGSTPKGSGLFASVDDLVAQRRYAHEWQLGRLNHYTSQQAGDVKSAFKGRGMEFEEIRAYTFGDDVRDIDWRVTARKQQPYTKLYNEEKDREVYVLLDFSQTMAFGTRKELKSVTAAKIAARIGWQCLKNKDRFGCVIHAFPQDLLFKAQHSLSNMMLIFQKMEEASRGLLEQKVPESSLKNTLYLLQTAIKSRAIVFVISDFADFSDDIRKILAMLAKKADVTCVNVFDCLEQKAPIPGEYMVQDGGKRLVFSSANKVFRKEYETYFAQKHQQLRDFCRQFHLHYLEEITGNCH